MIYICIMKGFIYEIKCNETNEIYIGSTVKSLKDRMRIHIQSNHCCSNQIIERNNYSVNILEHIEFIDIKDLRIREQFYIDNTICINKMKAFYTDADKELSKIKIKQYQKEYRDAHKDKMKAYNIQYRELNRDILNDYDKLRRIDSKDKVKEYNREYYQKNKIK
jgi:hypothetical protein